MKGGTSTGTSQDVDLAPGRVIVGNRRFSGCVQEWTSNGYGWIVPLEAVPHPAAKRRNGRIYVEQRDVRDSQALEVGTNVEFVLYADVRGLGAVNVEIQAEDSRDEHVPESEVEAPLPAGWEKVWSEEHEQFYFWHQATKESSWEHPAGEERGARDKDEEGAPLPPGWERHYDEEGEGWYFWNRLTKESTWDKPEASAKTCAPERRLAADVPPDSKNISSKDDGQTRVQGKVTNWQTVYGWMVPIGHVGKATRGLIDSHGGKIFLSWRDAPGVDIKVGTELEFEIYVDDRGLCAADIHPISENKVAAGMAAKKGAGKGKKGSRGKGKANASADPMADLELQWAKQDRKLGVSPAAPAKRTAQDMDAADAEEPPSDGPLMPGWEQHWSEEHSCYYYWHKASKQTTWDRPSMPVDFNEDFESRVPGSMDSTRKMATPMTPLESRAGGSAITPITAMPRKMAETRRAQQPSVPPPTQRRGQHQNIHANRPIVPVWQQQSGKRARH